MKYKGPDDFDSDTQYEAYVVVLLLKQLNDDLDEGESYWAVLDAIDDGLNPESAVNLGAYLRTCADANVSKERH